MSAQAQNKINPATGINWPANCSNSGAYVYSFVINSCVAIGTAANPAGASGYYQINTGGVFGSLTPAQVLSNILALPLAGGALSGALSGPAFNGLVLNATTGYQYQGGAGNIGAMLVSNGLYFVLGTGPGTRVVYASAVTGATPGVTVIPGSSATGTADSSAALNAAIAGGNVDLEVDSGYALSTSLVLYSNTTVHCTTSQAGFIMQSAANTPVFINAHTNAPTTTNLTGGFLASNFGDTNITVRNCEINANSTQAVTGTNSNGVAHSATPGGYPTAKFVGGVEFYGVNGLVFENNDCYDSATWCFFGSNDQYVQNNFNHYHQPQPMVHFKNTGGYQFDGPDQFLFSTGNRINAGDDSIAYNADDGQVPGAGDPNAAYIKSFVKWGNITDVQDSNETFENTFFGVRLLSTNDLIDRVNFENIQGQACGNTATLMAAYPSVGPGNLGDISFRGWKVPTSGACDDYGAAFQFHFNVSSNIASLLIDGLQLSNPAVSWPVIFQSSGYIGHLSLRNWTLNTVNSQFSAVVFTSGGFIENLAASGISWINNANSGVPFFAGSAVPAVLTLSNYAGPADFFSAGYVPPTQNGDAFTNTYSTTYVSTIFNESIVAGTAVAGTSPNNLFNGGVGGWTASSGGPTSGALSYTGTSYAQITGPCASGGPDVECPVTINPGVANYTMRVGIEAAPNTSLGFDMRWTNQSNFVTWVVSGTNQWKLCDVVSGTTTCGSAQTLPTGPGNYTITMNGTTSTLSNGSTKITGTISSSNTAGGAGINSNATTAGVTLVMSYFSIKSK